jgi:phytanoyl-CoA hydroxylase
MQKILTLNPTSADVDPSVRVKEPNGSASAPFQKSTYRSRFGGLWPDLSNAMDVVAGKLMHGLISQGEAEMLRNWIVNGFVIIENAVPHDVIDRVLEDTERVWTGAHPSIFVEHFVNGQIQFSPARPDLRMALGKLLDLYAVSEAAREAVFSGPIRNFLRLIFERAPLAFQSLSFMAGSGQPIHQDTAYVVVSSPIEFAASWIALEDIQPNSGELEYYEGSHKMEEFLFQGKSKSMPPGDPDHVRFLESLHEQAARMGLKRAKFRPKKGDALIWSADLAHGGSTDRDPATTRYSLVTHYCPAELEPAYFAGGHHSGKLRYAQDCFYSYPLR